MKSQKKGDEEKEEEKEEDEGQVEEEEEHVRVSEDEGQEQGQAEEEGLGQQQQQRVRYIDGDDMVGLEEYLDDNVAYWRGQEVSKGKKTIVLFLLN